MYQEGFTIVVIIIDMPITIISITPITITPITITSTICNDDTSVGGIESPLLLGHQSRYWPEPCLVLGKALIRYKARYMTEPWRALFFAKTPGQDI